MKSRLRVQLYIISFLILLALPLVFVSGTTWDSDSDDLLPTLISIENWRFLFWGHSRFGTLVPLLAKPFSDMPTNLLFQNFIHSLSLIIFVYALCRVFYSKQEKSFAKSVVFSALVCVFLFANPIYLGLLISGLPYAAPLGIFGISLLLANSNFSPKLVVPILIALTAISCWVNPLNGYYLAPLIFLLIVLKKFRAIFYEITLSYLFVTFGLFFIVLGLANGENGGLGAPNFRAFHALNWWLPLFVIQFMLIVRALVYRELKKFFPIYLSFLLTWVSIFALSSLKHINMNGEAPRYFITATFISMCITMKNVEEILNYRGFRFNGSKLTRLNVAGLPLILVGITVNILIINNLRSDYPLRQPQKSIVSSIFNDRTEPYKFASGDFWWAWPTKLFVSKPDDIFVTAFQSENQYDIATDSESAIQSRLKNGDKGLCFGKLQDCELQLEIAVSRIYGSFNYRIKIIEVETLAKLPIEVRSLRIQIISK